MVACCADDESSLILPFYSLVGALSDTSQQVRGAPVCIVLVETSDPGNIGAAARAMKTMGLSDLRLVNPQHFPHPKAIWRSKAAKDVVAAARVYSGLKDAIADCRLAVATSARMRTLPWPVLSPRQLAERAQGTARRAHGSSPLALVFGREKTGLSNEELQLCQWHCVIPANPDYPVLNLSHAVQLLCYELYSAQNPDQQTLAYESDQPLADQRAIDYMFTEFCAMLDLSGFSHKDDAGKLIPRLRRFFARAQLDKMEVNIWHGIVARIVGILERDGALWDKEPKRPVVRSNASSRQDLVTSSRVPTNKPVCQRPE